MKFSIRNVSSKYDQIRQKLLIFSNLLKKALMKNFFSCAVKAVALSNESLRKLYKASLHNYTITTGLYAFFLPS